MSLPKATVQPEPEDTNEELVQKVLRDRIEEEGGTWIKHLVSPMNPSDLEKEFEEAMSE